MNRSVCDNWHTPLALYTKLGGTPAKCHCGILYVTKDEDLSPLAFAAFLYGVSVSTPNANSAFASLLLPAGTVKTASVYLGRLE